MPGVSLLLVGVTLCAVAAMLTMAGALRAVSRDRREAKHTLADSHARLDRTLTELRTATAEFDSFAYSVAHDLRAPLRAIDGFSRALVEDFADKLEPEADRLLDIVRRNSLRLGTLMDDLLAYSRLSRQPLEKRRIEPVAIVRRILSDDGARWGNRAVAIEIGELPACEADPRLLHRLYAALIDNAMKFTQKAEDPRITIGSLDGSGPMVYFVADNGVGFDPVHAGKLFGLFQRLHRMEDYDGTGTGLAVAQRIVHRHGGAIWAKAEPGAGATFLFTLAGAAP
jgi:light-regulated signal transduction histidine kinase (bacteriophytochrome)